MKKKNKKIKIIIKRPALKILRNNLRKIIQSWYLSESKNISNEMIKIRKLQKDAASKDTPKEWYKLHDAENLLRQIFNASICVCRLCHAREKDMIYDPFMGEWLCLDCHKRIVPILKDPRYQKKIQLESGNSSLEEFKATMQKNFGVKGQGKKKR